MACQSQKHIQSNVHSSDTANTRALHHQLDTGFLCIGSYVPDRVAWMSMRACVHHYIVNPYFRYDHDTYYEFCFLLLLQSAIALHVSDAKSSSTHKCQSPDATKQHNPIFLKHIIVDLFDWQLVCSSPRSHHKFCTQGCKHISEQCCKKMLQKLDATCKSCNRQITGSLEKGDSGMRICFPDGVCVCEAIQDQWHCRMSGRGTPRKDRTTDHPTRYPYTRTLPARKIETSEETHIGAQVPQ